LLDVYRSKQSIGNGVVNAFCEESYDPSEYQSNRDSRVHLVTDAIEFSPMFVLPNLKTIYGLFEFTHRTLHCHHNFEKRIVR